MDKVEKFKELLIEYGNVNECIGVCTSMSSLDRHYHKKDKLEQKLIKMFSELEIKTEKTIINVKYIELQRKGYDYFNTVIWHNKKGLVQKYFTNILEEKDGMLITDDFIFVKE